MLPVYEIVDFDKNRYLLSKAVMKRARQIIFAGDEQLEEFHGKIGSLALKEILHGEIKYRLVNEQKKKSDIK